MSDNVIGGENPTKGKHCAHCGEAFGFQEFSDYMFKIWSNHIVCITCQEKNYLASTKNSGLKIALVMAAVLIGLTFFFGVNIMFGMATYNEVDGSYYISYLLVAIGIFGGVGFAKYLMAIFRWLFGTLMKKNLHH